ncbi:MAG: thermonuclease family protein [Eubacteriales bacterium]|nr:thermonuclease family protein [Eubacteriales bacterium]
MKKPDFKLPMRQLNANPASSGQTLPKSRFGGGLAVFLLVIVLAFRLLGQDQSPLRQPRDASLTEVTIERVVDGDTLIVDMYGSRERVRLIGIDAPESVSDNPDRITEAGLASADYLKKFLADYQGLVYLEYDQEPRDQYDRLLAYVWLGNTLLNEKICRDGYAEARSYPPNTRYDKYLQEAMEFAQQDERGIWSPTFQD